MAEQQKKSTALLLLNGACPPLALVRTLWQKTYFRLFADGATTPKPRLFKPDLILGDLDSLQPSLLNQGIATKKVLDQQKTDGEKCLEYLAKQAFTHTHVLGFDGQRLDHSLYNLKLLCQFSPQFEELVFWNEFEQVFIVQHSIRLKGFIGQRISFFPCFAAVKNLSTHGLAYNLTRQDLDFQGLCSISNQFAANEIHIQLTQGQLLVFLEHQLLS